MSSLNYDELAFILIRPPATVVSSHRIKNRQQHTSLLETAKNNNLLLYYSHATKKDSKYIVDEPLIIDEESAKNFKKTKSSKDEVEKQVTKTQTPISKEQQPDIDLRCPFCNKKMTSTPGRTLHVKHKHPEKYKEYKDGL